VLDGILHMFTRRPFAEVLRDLLDIFIVAYFIYRALLVLRGTRAMQMGVGLVVVFLVYLGAKALELVTLINLMSWLLSSIILVVVVVFQNDIRRALVRVGGQTWWTGGRKQEQTRVLDEVIAAVTELARHRIGALIAFELDANLLEFTKSEGIPIGSHVSRELLVAMFYPESVNKLHDGAIIIRDLKIERAGVFFPMPDVKIRDAALGSRHRAAIGITEETDAVVVVVSEERGTVSVCFDGNIIPNLDGTSLRNALAGLFGDRNRGRARRAAHPPGRPSISPAGHPHPGPSSTGRTSQPTPSSSSERRSRSANATVTPRASDAEPERISEPPPPPGDRPSPEPRVTRTSIPMPTGGHKKSPAATTGGAIGVIVPAALTSATPAPPRAGGATTTPIAGAPPIVHDDDRAPESRRETFVPSGGAASGTEDR
jgi:diadenylate cyclase